MRAVMRSLQRTFFVALVFAWWPVLQAQDGDTLAGRGTRAALPPVLAKAMFLKGPGVDPLEQDHVIQLAPNTTTVGSGFKWFYLEGTTNRCISYVQANGLSDETARITHYRQLINDKVLDPNARFRIQVLVVAENPHDEGTHFDVRLEAINGHNIAGSNGQIVASGRFVSAARAADPAAWAHTLTGPFSSIPSEWLHYGSPKFTSDTPFSEIVTNGWLRIPTPGSNQLRLSMRHSDHLLGTYTLSIWATLSFRAMDPIMLIHGTSAEHTSWTELAPTRVKGVDFGTPADYFKYTYKGLWFYNLDLSNRRNPPPFDQIAFKDNLGNGGLREEGQELQRMLGEFLLKSMGASHCHLVAHSKGGSDCRALIYDLRTQPLDQPQSRFSPRSLTTFGTPNLGSITADIAVDAGMPVMVSPGYLTNYVIPMIASDLRGGTLDDYYAASSRLSMYMNATPLTMKNHPSGKALLDQRLNVAKTFNYWTDDTAAALKGHYYCVRGDADVDNTSKVDQEEATPLIGEQLSRIGMGDVMYQLMGRVTGLRYTQQVATGSDWEPGQGFGHQARWQYVNIIPHRAELLPNDMVTDFESGQGPGAIPLHLRIDADGSWTSKRPGLLDPGNHALIKSAQAMQALVVKLKEEFMDPAQSGGF